MKSSRNIFPLVALLLLCISPASAQTIPSDAKEFNKDGLTFNYSASWIFKDDSNADAQQMTFGRADSEAQLTVFVFRTPLTSPERVAEAKKVLVDKYIASTMKSFDQSGGHPQSTQASSEIGGVKSEGVKIRASLDGIAGLAEIQSAVVEGRLVVLTFLGPDRALTKAAPTWDLVRNTIKIAAPVSQPKPSPTTTP
jgi:hypothetical protein